MGQIALRKLIGTTTELASVIGKNGDEAVDITKPTKVIFDGITAGGIPLAQEIHTHPDATSLASGFMSAASLIALTALEAIGDANSSTHGYMSAADYNLLQALAANTGTALPNSSGDVPNTLVLRDASGNFAANIITATLNGSVNGNAASVTNGVVTTGSYSNPSWIVSLDGSKITGTIGGGVTFAGSVPWTSVTGKPSVVSYFTNDAGYINGSGNTTGTAGGIQSGGGRETASPNANTVILRDGSGRAQIITPVASGDIANKAYVDANSGGFGYTPRGPVYGGNPISAGGTIATFSTIAFSESATGYLKTLRIDTFGMGVGNRSNFFVGFTTDGSPENTFSVADLISNYGIGNEVTLGIGGNTSAFTMVFDLAYKINISIRLFTVGSITVLNPEFAFWINRYTRVS